MLYCSQGIAQISMLNPTGFTRVNEEGLLLGKVTEAEMVSPKEQQAESSQLSGEEGAMECHESYVKHDQIKERLMQQIEESDLNIKYCVV